MDWDNKIGFWIKPSIYLWIGHPDIYNCRRIYLVPNETKNGDVLFFDDSFARVCRKYTLDIDPLYLLRPPSSPSTNNMSCLFIFRSFLRAISMFDVLLYIKEHKEMHPTEKYTYELRKIEKDGTMYIPFYPDPFIIHSDISIADTYDIYDSDKIYSFPIEYIDNYIDAGTYTYQGMRFYLSSESFLKNTDNSSRFRINSFEMQGLRPNMEDTTLICDMGNDTYMFAVLDGHGDNGKVSRHFSIDIPAKINFLLRKEKDNISKERYKKIIEEAILLSDESFYYINSFLGGTCFSGVLITNHFIFVINIGDSRTVVMHSNRSPLFITKDHKPQAEKSRNLNLHKKNKVVDPNFVEIMKEWSELRNRLIGPKISEDKTDTNLLSLSRALGDNAFKYDYSKSLSFDISLNTSYFDPTKKVDKSWKGVDAYLSPLPDINIFPREQGMEILIHCDGVNEPPSMQNEEGVIEWYMDFLSKNPYENVSRELCRHAFRMGSRDNLSCLSVTIL